MSSDSVRAFEYLEFGAGPRAVSAPMPAAAPSERPTSPNIDQLIAEAKAAGFAEGVKQSQQNTSTPSLKPMEEITTALRNFQQEKTDYYGRVEVELVHLALSIAAKILHREAQVDRMLVGALVKVALDKIQKGSKVDLHVSPEEIAAWSEYLEKNLGGRANLNVTADTSIKPGHCTLRTELGETEIGIEAQLKEIERGFFDLLAQRPDSK
jgi:flagellar assembly protein FliH